MIELNGVRIWAVPYRGGRPLPPRKLPCGTIVARPTPDRRSQVPPGLPGRLALPTDPTVSVGFSGLFVLASGDLAAVYGAVLEPIGGGGTDRGAGESPGRSEPRPGPQPGD